MSSAHRTEVILAILAGIALTLGLTYVAFPGSTVLSALSMRCDFTGCESAEQIANRGEELHDKFERLRISIRVGDNIARQLAIGSLTLARATEQMEPEMRTRVDFESVSERWLRAPNIHLGTARFLIDKVRRLLQDEPIWWPLAAVRLEFEYIAMQ